MSNEQISHTDKIAWMALWCAKNKVTLDLEGECGFGRECVGITTDGGYPDYEWYDETTYERADQNGDVWTPPDAYHKHTCVAVLGRGEAAEAQLYDWLKWFDDHGFVVEKGVQPIDPRLGMIAVMLGKHMYKRLVRKPIEALTALKETP